jgi:hypothetical protein
VPAGRLDAFSNKMHRHIGPPAAGRALAHS